MTNDAMTKAIDAARDAAEQRQRWGARELERLVPADGVLQSCRVSRTSNVLVQLVRQALSACDLRAPKSCWRYQSRVSRSSCVPVFSPSNPKT